MVRDIPKVVTFMHVTRGMIFAFSSVLQAVLAQDLTPRELFFSAPASPVKIAAPSVSTGKPQQKAQTVAKAPQKPAVQANAKNRPASAQNLGTPDTPIPTSLTGDGQRVATANGGEIVPALAITQQESLGPLGMRYSLLLARNGSDYKEVDTDTTFRAGDRLKLALESNSDAYLYVISRGSSGTWRVLFPSSEVENGNNRVKAFQQMTFPPGGRWLFDEQAGEEKLFLVLSRKPEDAFDDLIYKISNPEMSSTPPSTAPLPATHGVPAATEKPAGDKPADKRSVTGRPIAASRPIATGSSTAGRPAANPPAKQLQVAEMIQPIDDALVGRVRASITARDLVFEKVDDTKPFGEAKRYETATYVVSKNGSPDAKLVIDLSLRHQ